MSTTRIRHQGSGHGVSNSRFGPEVPFPSIQNLYFVPSFAPERKPVQKPPALDRRSHSHPIHGLTLFGLANFKYADSSKGYGRNPLGLQSDWQPKVLGWVHHKGCRRPEHLSQMPGLARRRQLRAPQIATAVALSTGRRSETSRTRALSRSDFSKPGRQNDFELPEFRDCGLIGILASRRRSSLPLELPREYPPGHKVPSLQAYFIDRTVRFPHRNLDAPGLGE